NGHKAYALTFTPSEQGTAKGVSVATVRPALARLGEIVKVLPRAVPESPEAPAGLLFELLVISDADPAELAAAACAAPDSVEPVTISEAPAPDMPGLPA